MGKHARNKTMVEFPRGNRVASNKDFISIKVAGTATLTNYLSQIRLSNESDILLTTFGPAEITQDEIKDV